MGLIRRRMPIREDGGVGVGEESLTGFRVNELNIFSNSLYRNNLTHM